MENLACLFLLVLFHSSQSVNLHSCQTNGKVMNCTGRNLKDCPSFSKKITNLILDNNAINNFSTRKCQSWNQLTFLSVRNNQLKEINLTNFTKLQKIDLSHNLIVNIKLNCSSLTTLIANSNKLSQIDFSIFNKQNLSIDFSNNNIIEFKAINNINIFKLNLSNNQLTKINGEQMNNFINLKFIDISYNPLSCFCNESRSFIDWVIQHKALIVNSGKTFCKTSMKQSISDVKCPQSSTKISSQPSTRTTLKISTRMKATSTKKLREKTTSKLTTWKSSTWKSSSTNSISITTHLMSTNTPPSSTSSTNKSKRHDAVWKIVLAVIIPLAAILAIIGCYCWLCRHKNKYQRFDR